MKLNSKKQTGVVIAGAIVMTALTVLAASVHLLGSTSFTDNGTTATVCGTLAGLGNGDITLTLVGSGTETTACTNPAGNFAPGNPGDVVVGGSGSIPATDIKNGRVDFCVTTTAPTCQTAKDCGCPNNNWTGTVTDVDFSSMTLIVEQGGKVVLRTKVK